MNSKHSSVRPSSSVITKDHSRVAILNGWILSMVGIVFYCLAMLDDSSAGTPYATIFERGLYGWAAVTFLIIGASLWMRGALVFLRDVEHSNLPDDLHKTSGGGLK